MAGINEGLGKREHGKYTYEGSGEERTWQVYMRSREEERSIHIQDWIELWGAGGGACNGEYSVTMVMMLWQC